MKVVLFSALQVGYEALLTLLGHKCEVQAVFTVDDNYIRSSGMDASYFVDFAEIALEKGIPLHMVGNLRDGDALAKLTQLEPDIIVCIGWPLLVPQAILDIPPRGVVTFHPGMLPLRRGGAPLNWALIDGLDSTGVSMYYMDKGIDTGDIIAQREMEIGKEDTAGSLLARFGGIAVVLLDEYYPLLENGEAPRTAQDNELATFTRRRKPEDGEIIWRFSTQQIHNLVRATTKPFPGAYTFFRGQRLTIWKARLPVGVNLVKAKPPGSVAGLFPEDKAFAVATGDHAILVTLVQLEGEEIVSGLCFAEECGLRESEVLGSEKDL
jgi:methionyl-tRNA formyltransferase